MFLLLETYWLAIENNYARRRVFCSLWLALGRATGYALMHKCKKTQNVQHSKHKFKHTVQILVQLLPHVHQLHWCSFVEETFKIKTDFEETDNMH